MQFTLYGASDDLVEVTLGGKADEFSPDSADRWSADLIGPGADEQMRVHCWLDDTGGCWQAGVGQTIEDRQLPAWPITITQAPAMNPSNPGYSALLTVEVPDGTRLDNIQPPA